MCVCSYPWKREDGTELFEAGGTSTFMPPDVSAGIQISILCYIGKHSRDEASPQTQNQST